LTTLTFAELGLSPKVQAAVDASGYTIPTPIQAAAIPVAIQGRDILGIAQTGTGKTASFTLPMICRLETGRARARMPRSLILAPTRELAAQVAQSFEKYGTNHKLNLALLIGGVSMDEQSKKLDRGVDVLIATPGRLIDHFQRGRVMLMGVEILVIDEADRMLDMGFIPDIEKICKLLPPRRQTLFFSATMPPEITRLVDQFMNEPTRIEVAKPATTANTITQLFKYCADGEDWAKREVLRDLMRADDVKNAIVFCNRKRDVAILHKSLVKHGFNAGALHGDMDQKSRTETLDKFRSGEIAILAASDVAARGLDIPAVSHVFNFDLPWQSDDYVHRIGRTGRAGREGNSTSLVAFEDLRLVADIEKITGTTAKWIGEPPTEEEISDSLSKKGRRSRSSGRPSERRNSRSSGGDKRGALKTSRRPVPAATVPVSPVPASNVSASSVSVPRELPEQAVEHVAVSGGAIEKAAPAKPRRSRRSEPAVKTAKVATVDEAPARTASAPKKSAPQRRQRVAKSTDNGSELTAPAQGFADNIPAFLRRPVRRPERIAKLETDHSKAASE
jgi:superfamily II DNA/RNA helicase